jgi:molybdate transport system substrate-binding protein
VKGRSLTRASFAFFCLFAITVRADSLLIAVASNFALTAQEVASEFEAATGHKVLISSASTGKLYLQIRNGAPFDVFLAADSARPKKLDAEGLGVPGTRRTYAYGQLVLWSRDKHPENLNCQERLQTGGFGRLSIANPDTAPYGAAAEQFLLRIGLWERTQAQLVIGENISQTLQFVASGNAGLGLVALSQLNNAQLPEASCEWLVPADMHDPIDQQAILLSRAADKTVARAFLGFLHGKSGRAIVARSGYLLSAGSAL